VSAGGTGDPIEVWIDLANSPHPLLFAPVARRIQELGHRVVITARDHAQTVELARRTWPELDVVGGPSPRSRLGKTWVLLDRARALRAWARDRRPLVAMSHNSYAQIVAARALRIPVVTAMDFEHQPANHLAFRLATRVLLPEALPRSIAKRQGATERKVRRYPGLKEALYLGDFEPNPHVLHELGISREDGRALVVARTPPARALYHRFGNPLFAEALRVIARQPDVRCVVLPRYPEQVQELAEMNLANCIVSAATIDSRSLMYEADLVIGAGGTMTREAALMGVPTFTLFAGPSPAVDRWLEERGELRRLTAAEQIATIGRRAGEPHPIDELRRTGRAATEVFVEAAVGA
jgi:predicted glycosyltransferase